MAGVEARGTRIGGGRRTGQLPRPHPSAPARRTLPGSMEQDPTRRRLLASTAEARNASRGNSGLTGVARMPWLAVGRPARWPRPACGRHRGQMANNLAVAYFIRVGYLADAVGTQTGTLAIRGLSVGAGLAASPPLGAHAPVCSSTGCLLAAAMLPLISWLWHARRSLSRCRYRCWRPARLPLWSPWPCPGCCIVSAATPRSGPGRWLGYQDRCPS